MRHFKCPNCGSENTKVLLEETLIDTEDGHLDEILEAVVECQACEVTSPFPEELDWRDYL